MLSGHDIVCIAPSFWRMQAPLNVHHLMVRLARDNRVLLVESLGLRPPARTRNDMDKSLRRLRDFLSGLRRTPEGVWLLSPLVAPWPRRRWALRMNRAWLTRMIAMGMRRLGMKDPILWIFLPTGAEVAGSLGEKLIIYHCVDAYADNPRVDRPAILDLERRLLEVCDLVFCTSRPLYEEKRPLRGASHYVPNVADVAHFEEGGAPPPEVASLPRPILGYVGNVAAYKIDVGLLEHVARLRPEWTLCFIGPLGAGDPGTSLERLRWLPNVRLMGPRPYEILPSYVAAFDVCLIPFRRSPSTRASFPLKFYEYMAAGKEIVSTPLEALSDYRSRPELCRFASSAGEFVQAIEDALATPPAHELVRLRREEARRNSWDVRMDQISGAVEDALARRAQEQRASG